MPYHDPEKPFVNAWFASSEGSKAESFVQLISEANQEALEESGGACIMYTHFAHGFVEHGRLNRRFKLLLERLAERDGWFVPVRTLLGHLRASSAPHVLTTPSAAPSRDVGCKRSCGTGPPNQCLERENAKHSSAAVRRHSDRDSVGMSDCRNCTYPDGTSMPTMKYARESEKRTEMLSESRMTVSSTSRPFAIVEHGEDEGASRHSRSRSSRLRTRPCCGRRQSRAPASGVSAR